jgi:hypothetical protein
LTDGRFETLADTVSDSPEISPETVPLVRVPGELFPEYCLLETEVPEIVRVFRETSIVAGAVVETWS